jgi:hypothetical protein
MSVADSSLQFGTKLVTNVRDALLFDRSRELEIEIDNLILRQNGESMGDIDMKVTSLKGPTELKSLAPSSSLWRPASEGLLVEKSWWEFKRSCPLLKMPSGQYRPNQKLDSFISFYEEYFSVFETTANGPVVFAFNGADHIDVLNYLKSKLGEDLKIKGHDVFCVHVDSDDIAKWMTEKELHESEQERFRLEEERFRLEEERRQAILNLHRKSPNLTVDDIAGIFRLSVDDVNAIISIGT